MEVEIEWTEVSIPKIETQTKVKNFLHRFFTCWILMVESVELHISGYLNLFKCND